MGWLPRRNRRNCLNFLLVLTVFYLAILTFNAFPLIRPEYEDANAVEYVLPYPTEYHKIPNSPPDVDAPGELGQGVKVPDHLKAKSEQQIKGSPFMSEIASDMISYDRSLKDVRSKACKDKTYDDYMPMASVIIIFKDEPFSSLVRTVHSIVNRSPPHLLKEIILVDDTSTIVELGSKLENHLARFNGLVRLIRAKKRLGLIRARLTGAKAANGDVLIFIDAHCEAAAGWLEPLLDRITENHKAVVSPVIDYISPETLKYDGGSAGGVGGFWWSLHYKMEPIPKSEIQRRKNPDTDYLRSPTMAGGLFAVNRHYFFEIGAYDDGMEIWGGENLEISFRVWMCGGSIEIIPCSHVGHIYRAGHPYNMTSTRGNPDVHGYNSKRLADVWMDDYKRLFYRHRNSLQNSDAGNLTERKALRKNLNCENFSWYLKNITPYMFIPDENVKAHGYVRNQLTGLCLDTLQRNENKGTIVLGVYGCQAGSEAQMFSLSKEDELRRETTCVTVPHKTAGLKKALLQECSSIKKNLFTFTNGMLIHNASRLCLDATGLKDGDDAFFAECSGVSSGQRWNFEHNMQK
uniref:Polypeptide N-acetylgalactosaminyltransferase n=1 Tax=Panagrellus redivivus TaxID=6233 RepID=A0A7E4ZXM1_PANRE